MNDAAIHDVEQSSIGKTSSLGTPNNITQTQPQVEALNQTVKQLQSELERVKQDAANARNEIELQKATSRNSSIKDPYASQSNHQTRQLQNESMRL